MAHLRLILLALGTLLGFGGLLGWNYPGCVAGLTATGGLVGMVMGFLLFLVFAIVSAIGHATGAKPKGRTVNDALGIAADPPPADLGIRDPLLAERARDAEARKRAYAAEVAQVVDGLGPQRFRVVGVDRASSLDTELVVDAASEANAKVKAELEGMIVTAVERA